MEDREILDCIRGLVAEEHWLRQQRDQGELSEDVEVRRLAEVERSLDQLWGLLRRRRAMRAAGLNPDIGEERPFIQLDTRSQ
jgi:hypothetical protein